jgi:S1-C subfamily serine protease
VNVVPPWPAKARIVGRHSGIIRSAGDPGGSASVRVHHQKTVLVGSEGHKTDIFHIASSATSQLSGGAGATSGALVSGLSSGGPAAKAGVQDGDVITKIDGIPVTDAPDLLTVLATEKPVDTVTLGLDRNGSSLSVQVQLGELPG